MNLLPAWLSSKLLADPWPEAKPLPEHVARMPINHQALALHMARAKYPDSACEVSALRTATGAKAGGLP